MNKIIIFKIKSKKIKNSQRKNDFYPLYLIDFDKFLFVIDSTHRDLQTGAIFRRGWRPAPRRAAKGENAFGIFPQNFFLKK